MRTLPPLLSKDAPTELGPDPFANLSNQEQEHAVLDDLLYVFTGYEGQYIRFTHTYEPSDEKSRLARPTFYILPGLDPSLRGLATSMITMATHYCAIEATVEVQSREEYGSVNHALCAAIRKLLKDYLILIAQLETKVLSEEKFTLRQMLLSIMPTAQSLAQLYAMAQELLGKNSLLEEDIDDSADEFDTDSIIEREREGGIYYLGACPRRNALMVTFLRSQSLRLGNYSSL